MIIHYLAILYGATTGFVGTQGTILWRRDRAKKFSHTVVLDTDNHDDAMEWLRERKIRRISDFDYASAVRTEEVDLSTLTLPHPDAQILPYDSFMPLDSKHVMSQMTGMFIEHPNGYVIVPPATRHYETTYRFRRGPDAVMFKLAWAGAL